MKKYLLLLFASGCIGLTAFRYNNGFYSMSFSSIDNETVPLLQYQGKKVLIVVLPITATDSLSVTPKKLSDLAGKHSDSLVIVGVPGVETGYTDSKKEQIKAMYANLPANFILASGMKVTKTSGQDQAALFQWLTDVRKNKYFDNDVRGTGHKFFINRYGQLYASFGPQLPLSSPIIETVLSRPGSSGNK